MAKLDKPLLRIRMSRSELPGVWLAESADFDYMTQGTGPDGALAAFKEGLRLTLQYATDPSRVFNSPPHLPKGVRFGRETVEGAADLSPWFHEIRIATEQP